jgi:hypothetical protein
MMVEKKKVTRKNRTSDNSNKSTNPSVEPKEDFLGETTEEAPKLLDVTEEVGDQLGKEPVGDFNPPKVKEKGKKIPVGEEIVDEEMLKALNKAGDLFLECLPPGVGRDFRIACYKDFFMKDIGIYIMGLLNRMYKMGDYYNPDIEPEWDRRIVGVSKNLICNYCEKEIPDPQHINQLFCNVEDGGNLCAKRYKDRENTGVIFPNEKDRGSEAERDEKDWEREQKRLGVG